MTVELSLAELEAEMSAELPDRTMMRHRRRRRRHFGTSAFAAFGSVANANSTEQVIFNPQVAVVTGGGHTNAGIVQVGGNSNSNSSTQFGVPVNFGF